MLLYGPPGVGKTRLARALAGEAGVPFFSISGADFVEMFVGVGAARNRPDILDPALLRPGRFDRRIAIDPPDAAGRAAILALHLGARPLAADVDLPALAGATVGFSGADLANVVNEAALLATRAGAPAIGAAHVQEAVERVMAGPARRSRVLTPADRARIATHEAGHAVVGAALSGARAVAKVSVLARGAAGGATTLVAEPDRVLATRSELEDRLAVLLGGRPPSSSCSGSRRPWANDDLARAAALARHMVAECGMGARLGPYVAGPAEGRPDGAAPSGRLGDLVDLEANALVLEGAAQAAEVLAANQDVLRALAAALGTAESVEGDELARLLVRVRRPLAGGFPGARAGAEDLWDDLVDPVPSCRDCRPWLREGGRRPGPAPPAPGTASRGRAGMVVEPVELATR